MKMITSRELDAVCRAERRHSTAEENIAWHAYLRHEAGTEGLPDRVHDKVFSLAWQNGHAHGYSEVEIHYCEIAEVALVAYATGLDGE